MREKIKAKNESSPHTSTDPIRSGCLNFTTMQARLPVVEKIGAPDRIKSFREADSSKNCSNCDFKPIRNEVERLGI